MHARKALSTLTIFFPRTQAKSRKVERELNTKPRIKQTIATDRGWVPHKSLFERLSKKEGKASEFTVILQTPEDIHALKECYDKGVNLRNLRIGIPYKLYCGLGLMHLDKHKMGEELFPILLEILARKREGKDTIVIVYPCFINSKDGKTLVGWADEVVVECIAKGNTAQVPKGVKRVDVHRLFGNLDTSQAKDLKVLEIGDVEKGVTVKVPPSVEKVIVKNVYGNLDLSQASGLKTLEINGDIKAGATVGIPKGITSFKVNDVYGTLDASNALALEKLKTRSIKKGGTVKISPSVKEIHTHKIEGHLDLSKAKSLEKLFLSRIKKDATLKIPPSVKEFNSPLFSSIKGHIDFTEATNLKVFRAGDIKTNLVMPPSLTTFSTANINGNVDLSKAKLLRSIDICSISKGTTFKIPSWLEKLRMMDLEGVLDLNNATSLQIVAILTVRDESTSIGNAAY